MTKFQKQMMTIAAIGALSAVTALPAMAADVSFYGQARLATFYNMNTTDGGVDTNGFDEHLQGNSRFGANFKNGDFGGKFEVGTSGGNANIRLLYGTWNFGSGKLTVGQDYNRYWLGSQQVWGDDNGNNGYGSLWDGRQPQIRVDLSNGFYFSAIKPQNNADNSNQEIITTSSTTDNDNNEQYLPKLNVGYAGKAGSFSYNVGVVGQTYKDKDFDETVTSLMGYVTGQAGFGATSVAFTASYGQNVGNMGFLGRMSKVNADDVTGFEGMLQLSQKLSDTLSFNAGVGYVYDKSDADGADADDKMTVFANMPIKMAKYVTLVPEISYIDQLSEGRNASNVTSDSDAKQWAVGAKWQIDF